MVLLEFPLVSCTNCSASYSGYFCPKCGTTNVYGPNRITLDRDPEPFRLENGRLLSEAPDVLRELRDECLPLFPALQVLKGLYARPSVSIKPARHFPMCRNGLPAAAHYVPSSFLCPENADPPNMIRYPSEWHEERPYGPNNPTVVCRYIGNHICVREDYYFRATRDQLKSTMIHELIHCWLFKVADPSNGIIWANQQQSYHDKFFRLAAQILGLKYNPAWEDED